MNPSLLSTALALVIVGGAGVSTAFAGETKSRRLAHDPYEELTLPAREVADATWPWSPEVRACWQRHATKRARQDGNLRIEVIVDPTGMVWRHHVLFTGAPNRPLERCLDRVITRFRFPMRRGYTHAAIPFLFRDSAKPGTGPYRSCWNPRGCRRPRPRVILPTADAAAETGSN
jgi:hypothetical protein